MKFFFRFALILALFFGCFGGAKAQYVTISDPEFTEWLQFNFPACMTGNQMDTTCAVILTVQEATFSVDSSIYGIQFFDNLKSLNVTFHMDTLVIGRLPQTLKVLEVDPYNNGAHLFFGVPFPAGLISLTATAETINNLPPLPNDMDLLYFGCDDFNVFPTLPQYVDTLGINCNSMVDFPPLPSGLKWLHCSGLALQTIPPLPTGLKVFEVNNSLIWAVAFGVFYWWGSGMPFSQLPDLPSTVEKFYCSSTQVSSLPALPVGLKTLFTQNNPNLTQLPDLPSTLKSLQCEGNQLSTLPSLPDITSLRCDNNVLSTIPPLPTTLQFLSCSGNNLTSLPLLPASLSQLDCGGNALTAIPPFQGFNLQCNDNQLTELPSLPVIMGALNCSDNPNLQCLPPVKQITSSINIANTGITCLPNHIMHPNQNPLNWLQIDTLPLCPLINPGNCPTSWNIAGTAYDDEDGDCSQNAEDGLRNVRLSLWQNGTLVEQVFTNTVGNYSFQTTLDTFAVSVDTAGLPFHVSCPDSNMHTSVISASIAFDTAATFALQCNAGYDLATTHINDAGFFPNTYNALYLNAGDLAQFYGTTCNTTGLAGTVTATFSGPAIFVSASGGGTVGGNTVTWNVNDFASIGYWNNFWFELLTDTTATIGDEVCVTVVVAAAAGTDNDTSNNTFTQCFDVVNSYDPNVKEVYPDNVLQPGNWHNYIVHFQNTGTAAAQNIVIKDTLDSNLDWNSFQLLGYSHNNITQLLQDGIVHFNFPNIGLPDSTSNEPESHGWIQYRIKTDSTIAFGTIIHNTAAIYFDFNDPVITNDALVKYCTPVETQQTFTICEGDSLPVGNVWIHQGGVYTHVLTASTGCDSTVTTTLVVNPTVAFIENYTLCPGDSVIINGNVYHQAVSFTDTTVGANGCDVLLITNIYESIVDAAITLNNDTLTAAPDMESYQWIDCDLGVSISGATNQTFTPTQNGHYAVLVTASDACTDVSECMEVVLTGIHTVQTSAFIITPNPASNTVTVRVDQLLYQGEWRITDITGRIVYRAAVENAETNINVNDLVEGTYFLQLCERGKTTAVQKLVIMR